MHYLECTIPNKLSFPFWKSYVIVKLTLIDTSLQNLDNTLNIMNSIYSNIQFTYETENSGSLPALYTLVTRTEKGSLLSSIEKVLLSLST